MIVTALARLSFLLPPPVPACDSRVALHDALRMIALGESLGYAGAWVPWKGPGDAVWSAIALLVAATQHTGRIELGAHDVPLYDVGRHDLPAADLLSQGRFQLGLDDSGGASAPTYPGSEDLATRIWAEAGSLDAAQRAAAEGRHLFLGTTVVGDEGEATAAQAALVHAYTRRADSSSPRRVAVGRLVLPLDSADDAGRDRLRALAASTPPPATGLQVPALIGSSDELVERLAADSALAQASELRLLLPHGVDAGVHAQILHDVAEYVAPELGWRAPSRTPIDVTALYI